MKTYNLSEIDVAGLVETTQALNAAKLRLEEAEKAVKEATEKLQRAGADGVAANGAFEQAQREFLRRFPWAGKDCVVDLEGAKITGDGVPDDLAVSSDA